MRDFTCILLSLLLLLCACSGVSDPRQRLDRAEALMTEHPDSALAILQGVDTLQLSSKRQKARFCLYYICATDKKGIDIDSTFSYHLGIATAYFLKSRVASKDKMLTLYYNGLCNINKGTLDDGIIYLLKSRDIAQTLDDNLQLGLIHRYIADAFTALYDFPSALYNSKLSLTYFQKAEAKRYIPYAICDYAIMSNNATKYDDAIYFGKQAYNIGIENNDSNLIANAASVISIAYIAKKDYGSAIKTLTTLDSLGVPYSDICDIHNLGLAYLCSGDIEKAEKYSEILSECGDEDKYLIYNIAMFQNNQQIAIQALKEWNLSLDSLARNVMLQNASLRINTHYNSLRMLSESEAKRQQDNLLYIASICILIILCLLFIVLWQRRKRHYIELTSMQQVEALRDSLSAEQDSQNALHYQLNVSKAQNELANVKIECAKAEIEKARNNIKQIFAAQSSFLNQMCNAYYESAGTPSEKTKIYDRTMQLINDMRNDKKLKELELTINTHFNNLISDLRADYPNLKDNDIRMFMYIVVGISPCAMGILFEKPTETIHKRKNKLRQKLVDADKSENTKYTSFM